MAMPNEIVPQVSCYKKWADLHGFPDAETFDLHPERILRVEPAD